jgi:hypothetical protein
LLRYNFDGTNGYFHHRYVVIRYAANDFHFIVYSENLGFYRPNNRSEVLYRGIPRDFALLRNEMRSMLNQNDFMFDQCLSNLTLQGAVQFWQTMVITPAVVDQNSWMMIQRGRLCARNRCLQLVRQHGPFLPAAPSEVLMYVPYTLHPFPNELCERVVRFLSYNVVERNRTLFRLAMQENHPGFWIGGWATRRMQNNQFAWFAMGTFNLTVPSWGECRTREVGVFSLGNIPARLRNVVVNKTSRDPVTVVNC